MVAASFQALQASESPVMKGYTPPSAVRSVALKVDVKQPGTGEAQPLYSVPGGNGGEGGGGLGTGGGDGE